MRVLPFVVASSVAVSLFAFGCGKPTPGEAIRPKDPTFAEARGPAPECHEVQAEGTPLIVDWNPEERGDLEIAMKQGIAVVHYDCKSIKLLQDCHIEGMYGFLGMTTKEQVISFDNADQAQANLPLHGATLGADLKRGTALDIGLVMIGKKASTLDGVERTTLKGKCDGATHFVQSAMLGAFAMKTGTSGEVGAKAVVDVFGGVGASASSGSNRATVNKDGDMDSCKKADVDGEKAPNGCGALLRVRLLGITEGKLSDKPPPEAPKELACPAGLVAQQGKCAPVKADAPHDCTILDTGAECEKQCTNGSGESCGMAALFYSIGLGDVTADPEKSSAFANKGCALQDPYACDSVADDLLSKDKPGAISLYTKNCNGGYDQSCRSLGKIYADDGDGVKAVRYYQRACDAGEALGCLDAARIYAKGAPGVKPDPTRAVNLYSTVCYDEIVIADACYKAGLGYEKGDGVSANPVRAKALYSRACDKGHTQSCDRMKKLH